jgi:hypothetical protein
MSQLWAYKDLDLLLVTTLSAFGNLIFPTNLYTHTMSDRAAENNCEMHLGNYNIITHGYTQGSMLTFHTRSTYAPMLKNVGTHKEMKSHCRALKHSNTWIVWPFVRASFPQHTAVNLAAVCNLNNLLFLGTAPWGRQLSLLWNQWGYPESQSQDQAS